MAPGATQCKCKISPFLKEGDKCTILIKIKHNSFSHNLPQGWIQHDLVEGGVVVAE